jgi:phosphatidylserine/phosphatidylglycerophosphate/cardiolipin synthase-like enzyme
MRPSGSSGHITRGACAASAGTERSNRRATGSGRPASRRRARAAPSKWSLTAPPPCRESLRSLPRPVRTSTIAGWFVTPDFALTRDGGRAKLRALLASLAERLPVRVLLWAGSPLPLFDPDRRDVREVRRALTSGTTIEVEVDSKERPMHCHHEKLVVIDDRVAFVGGIDLTTYAGDRYDTAQHEARGSVGWHDALAVLRGPVVADVADHFRQRWQAVTGASLPAPKRSPSAGDVEVQFVRTVPEHVYDSVHDGDFRILEAYSRALRSARELIYLENQFLWSSEIARILEEKLARPPTDDFRMVLLLPASPNDGRDDTRGQLAELIECDNGAGRLFACSLFALGERGPQQVYVHAKIGIVDDRWLTIGSANINEHSLFNDTEANIVSCDAKLARETRLRLWAEHLERPLEEVAGPPARVVAELWKPIAEEQARRRDAGEPPTHRLCLLPHVSRRTRRLLGPVNGLLVDG